MAERTANRIQNLLQRHRTPRDDARIVQSWDTAQKGAEVHDHAVGTTWLHVEGKHFLIDVVREQCDYPTLSRLVLEQYGKHQPDPLLIEDHGSGTCLIAGLKKCHSIGAILIKPTRVKIVRLSNVSPMFERGEIFVPQNARWLVDFLDELLRFPQPDSMIESTASRSTLIGIAAAQHYLRCFGHDTRRRLFVLPHTLHLRE